MNALKQMKSAGRRGACGGSTDGVELGRATVTVTTLGEEFLRDVEGSCTVEDFPMEGQTVTLEWQQNSQNFVITDFE